MNKLSNLTNQNLPIELRKSQEAIQLPEVQEMLKKLRQYNLGVCMLHKHDEESGEFRQLPNGEVQLEDNLKVSFVKEQETLNVDAIPVSWTWDEDITGGKVVCVGMCSLHQKPTTT